ncbi:hypothetical protein [Candidiatus Paracoxiella cheracis]|uniref:hypothetical protein n=1 Tax=Candidiatus Paracoxiella cheracis TaxID=3405120 RepID=UPI003BF5DF3A
MKSRLIVLLGSFAFFFGTVALAGGEVPPPPYANGPYHGLYFEMNFGYGKVHQTLSNDLYTHNKGFTWNLDAGFQFTRNFAFEAGYISLPKVEGRLGYHADAWYMAFKGIYPVTSNFSAFGKLGFADSSRNGPLLLLGGIGLAYNFSPQIAITAQLLNIFGSTRLPNTFMGTAGISYKLIL